MLITLFEPNESQMTGVKLHRILCIDRLLWTKRIPNARSGASYISFLAGGGMGLLKLFFSNIAVSIFSRGIFSSRGGGHVVFKVWKIIIFSSKNHFVYTLPPSIFQDIKKYWRIPQPNLDSALPLNVGGGVKL